MLIRKLEKAGKNFAVAAMAAVIAATGLTACGKEPEQSADVSPTPEATLTPAATPTPEPTPTEAATPTPEPTPTEIPPEWIVENMNIGPAVALPSLKDVYSDYFKIGVGLTGYAADVVMVRSEAMSEVVKHHFNSTTLTNLMKPSYLLNQAGSIENSKNGDGMPAVKFDPCIEALTFTSENYPGVIYCWDVVNEAVEPAVGSHETETGYFIRTKNGEEENLWYKVVGADYVEKAFEYARKYAPSDVKLFYNDYNTFQPVKNEKICLLLKDLAEKGLVDGVGMQSYIGRDDPDIKGRTGSVQRAIENFAELGLEIQITELTINVAIEKPDERTLLAQAMRYQEMLELLTEMDTAGGGKANITSVTFFGLMDEYMLYPDNKEYSRLFDGELQPKEALFRILDVVKK